MRHIHDAPPRPRSGYTLVEVMVSLAGVSVLAALGFSGVQKVNRSADSVRTLSQLREIGVASSMWSNDHGAKFPPCWDNTRGRNRSYAQVLDPYVHGVDAYRRADSKFIGANKRLPLRITPYSHPITFSLNRSVSPDISIYGNRQEQAVSIHSVHDPAQVIFAIDGCQNPRNLNQANASTYEVFFRVGTTGPRRSAERLISVGPDADQPGADGWIRYPGGRAHALMCDGSARIFPKGSIKARNIWRSIRDD